MSIIKIGRERIAVDINWIGLSVQTDIAKQKKEVCEAAGQKVGYSVTDNSGIAIVGLPAETLAKGQVSGAATIAAAHKDANLLLVEPAGELGSEYWVCAIKNGAPVNGYDCLCSFDETRQLLIDARDGVFDEFTFYSKTDEFDDVIRDRSESSYAELTFAVKPVKAVHLVGLDPLYVWIGVGIILLALGAAVANRLYEQHRIEEARQREQDALLQAQESDKRMAAQAASKQRADLAAEVSRVVIDKPTLSGYMKAVWAGLQALPSSVAGWSIVGGECGPVDCLVSWKREPYGTAVNFLGEAEKRGWTIYSVSPGTIVTRFEFAAPKRNLTIGALKPNLPFLMAMSDAASRFGLVGGQAQLPTFVGLKRPDTTVDVEWVVGVLSLSGMTLHSMLAVPEYFESGGLAIRKLQFSPKGDWKMDIDAAAKAG